MTRAWSKELWRTGLILAVAALLGLISGLFWPLLAITALALVALQYLKLYRLAVWSIRPQHDPLPERTGAWAEVCRRFRRRLDRYRQYQQNLAQALDQYQSSAAALPDAAVVLGRDSEITWLNEASVRLLGLRPAEDTGRRLVDLFRNPELKHYLQAGDYHLPLEIDAPGRRGTKLAIRVFPYGEGQCLLMAQDITERLRLERVRTDFVANVSHELRTPLTVLSGFIENFQHDESDCSARWNRPLSLMEQQTRRMQRIVEDLLLLARLEGGGTPSNGEAVDVAAMARDIHDDMLSSRRDGIPELRLELDSSLQLQGDAQQLRSAFSNLVVNAVNYTAPEGRITLHWRLDGGQPVFEVEDTGEGIAPEHIARLTERFYRVDVGRSRQRGGTGLGLAIAKHVLQAHAAKLEIESQVGVGSRFRCRFPVEAAIRK